MRSIAAPAISIPKCAATRSHTAAGRSAWSTQIRRPGLAAADSSIAPSARAANSGRVMVGSAADRRRNAARSAEAPRRVRANPADWPAATQDLRGVALDPDPRRIGKGRGQDFLAADVPAGALEHQVLFVAVPASPQRPHQKPHYLHQCGRIDPIGVETEKRVQWRRFGDSHDAGQCAQEPGYQRRSASREVKDHARRVK